MPRKKKPAAPVPTTEFRLRCKHCRIVMRDLVPGRDGGEYWHSKSLTCPNSNKTFMRADEQPNIEWFAVPVGTK